MKDFSRNRSVPIFFPLGLSYICNFTGRGILGRGLKMSIDERQVHQEQSSPKRPVLQPSPGDKGRSEQFAQHMATAGRGIGRGAQQAKAHSSASETEVEGSAPSGSQQGAAPFGRGSARRAQVEYAQSPSEMEASAASSETGRRPTSLEERFRRMDLSDELVEERGSSGNK